MPPIDHLRLLCLLLMAFPYVMEAQFVTVTKAADWDDVPVPVTLPSGQQWQLLDVSDDFAYTSTGGNRPDEFTRRWNDSFINHWSGPGKTEWNPGHAYTTNGHLGIEANRKPGTDRVYTGCLSSKEAFTYPLFVEARVRISGLVLASNVWMLSQDSTEEIDIIEAYGSEREGDEWTSLRLHLSHHVFVREPFQDYQPTDEGSWFHKGVRWRDNFHRVGVYWRDPWHLEYYVDGEKVRTVSGREVIDPHGYTKEQGLTKPMRLIINAEDQAWRSDAGITPTDTELADKRKSIMWVDWIRAYQPTSERANSE